MNAIQTLLTDHLDIWISADTEKKSGRGRSSGNAANVYGIRKLRELILELAVRGKLVPQDTNDEPANVLLEKIAKEKARLIAEGKIKKDKPLPPISDDEIPFELPNGWLWTTLASISLVNPRNNAEDNSPASFVPMTMIGAKFNSSHDQEARLWKEIKQGFTHFAEGDVGVAKITPCFENSKACVFSGLLSGVGAGTTELHIVRPLNATLAPRFVLAYLKSPKFLLVGETRMTGTAGQKRLPKEFVESNPFPLPPLPEQHRIVAKVDELMALCDRLEQQQTHSIEAHQSLVEALLGTLTQIPVRGEPVEPHPSTSSGRTDFEESWQRIAAHFDTLFTTDASIDQLKQTILQLAVMGKLVPQDPNDESASELLNRKRVSGEGNLSSRIPESWVWARVDEFAQTRLGKMLDKAKNKGALVRYLRNVNVRWFDFDLSDVKEMRFEDSELEEFSLRCGDVMICEGGYPGRAAVWDAREADIYFQKAIHRVRFQNGVNPYYFVYVLRDSADSGRLDSYFTGAGIQHFTGKGLASFLVPLPPLAEQHRIVAKVDELMALCDTLKARLADAQAIQLHLADAIVEQAVPY